MKKREEPISSTRFWLARIIAECSGGIKSKPGALMAVANVV